MENSKATTKPSKSSCRLLQMKVQVEEQVCFDSNNIQTKLKKSNNDDNTAARIEEITDASIYNEDDDSLRVFEEGNDEIHKLFEEQNDEDPKVEEGYNNGIAQETPVKNENVLFDDSKVSTTGESFPNNIPASRIAGEIKVKHEPDDVSEVLTREPGINKDKVRFDMENIEGNENLLLI